MQASSLDPCLRWQRGPGVTRKRRECNLDSRCWRLTAVDSSQYTNSTTPAGFRSYEEFGGIEARARGRRGFVKSRARVAHRISNSISPSSVSCLVLTSKSRATTATRGPATDARTARTQPRWSRSVSEPREVVKPRGSDSPRSRASRVGLARWTTSHRERKQQPCFSSARVEVLEVLVDLLLAERRGALVPRIAYGIALGAYGEEDHREQMVDATADWLGRLRPPKGCPSRE